MEIDYEILFGFAAFLGLVSRQAGGGFLANKLPDWLAWLPESVLGLTFGYFIFTHAADWVLDFHSSAIWFSSILGAVWSYIWFQTGHGAFFNVGSLPLHEYNFNRKQTLSPIVDFLAPPGTVRHGFIGMALKGFLVTLLPAVFTLSLEVGIAGLFMGVAYWIDNHVFKQRGNVWGEILTGVFFGVGIGLAW